MPPHISNFFNPVVWDEQQLLAFADPLAKPPLPDRELFILKHGDVILIMDVFESSATEGPFARVLFPNQQIGWTSLVMLESTKAFVEC